MRAACQFSQDFWCGVGYRGQLYHSDTQFLLPFHALRYIAEPSPFELFYTQVDFSYFRHLFSSASSYPSRPSAIKSSIMKYSVFPWSCRLCMFYSNNRFLSRMIFRVYDIQCGVIHRSREGKLFVNRGLEAWEVKIHSISCVPSIDARDNCDAMSSSHHLPE